MTSLFTIGYEGIGVEDFIETLKQHGITLVIDVREKPLSRKKGFSKNSLSSILNINNIKYIHMGTLGSPSSIRDELHETNNYPLFFRKYLSHLIGQSGTLKALISKANSQKGTCLLCFEKDPLKCHRNVITDYLQAMYPDEVKVEHL